jgi:hypothetical protein
MGSEKAMLVKIKARAHFDTEKRIQRMEEANNLHKASYLN